MGYTSKYKGAEIDALLDKIKQGGTGGGGMEIYDLNIELPEEYADIVLNEYSLNHDGTLRDVLTNQYVEVNLNNGSLVNVSINGTFIFSGLVLSTTIAGVPYELQELVRISPAGLYQAMMGGEYKERLVNVNIYGMKMQGNSSCLISFQTYYETDVRLSTTGFNTIRSQDQEFMGWLWNVGSNILFSVGITDDDGTSQSYIRTLFKVHHFEETDPEIGVKTIRAYSLDGQCTIYFDKDGIIHKVVFVPTITQLEERIKALENGN